MIQSIKNLVKQLNQPALAPNIDKKTKGIFLTWGITMILFFIIAIVCVSFIFSPVEQLDRDTLVKQGATSLQGLKLMGESWRRYPNYTIGLGVAAVISFGGALFAVYNMVKTNEEKEG